MTYLDDVHEYMAGKSELVVYPALASIAESPASIATSLPQGPAETGTPLADTPAPAEPWPLPAFVANLPAPWVTHEPPQGSAAPPTDHGVEASRPSTAETVPTPAESSLDHLDRLEELAGEVRRWREADRLFPCDTTEWWDATLRFRDAVDRLAPAPGGAR